MITDTTKVQLSLKGRNLHNVAGSFKGMSDPYAIVTVLGDKESGTKPVVVGKTEVIKNNLSPDWTKVFEFHFHPAKQVHIVVGVYDEVKKKKHIKMGDAKFEIGSILGSRGNMKSKKLKGGGIIYAQISKSQGSGSLTLKMAGVKLKNKEGFMRKSDPFFEIYCKQESGAWDSVFRSSVCDDDLDPVWEEATIDLSILCGGDLDKNLKICVFDYESNGDHDDMGSFETTVNGLANAQRQGAHDFSNAFALGNKHKDKNVIVVVHASLSGLPPANDLSSNMESLTTDVLSTPPAPFAAPYAPNSQSPSFVDYISGGCELNMCVAIDFTGSNGDPRKPGTLHHFNSNGIKNDYEMAISALGNLLANYDSDQKYPVWGFGAKYDGIVRHCFQCGTSPQCSGVDGILQAYHHVFQSGLIMSGPTDITEVIQASAGFAESMLDTAIKQGNQSYTVLVILTDGSVSDVMATNAILNQVSDTPLSIIIVGIGGANFAGMQFLDDRNVDSSGRDNVQFVEFSSYKYSKDAFTAATLCELPNQLVEFFTSKGINPSLPAPINFSQIEVENEDEEIDLSLDPEDEEIIVEGGGMQRGFT